MSTITIQEAQARLSDLIHKLSPGEDVVITDNDQPVARLVAAAPPKRRPRQPGTLKGTVLYMAPDFDEPLDEFKDLVDGTERVSILEPSNHSNYLTDR